MDENLKESVCTFKLPERFTADTPRNIISELQDLPECDSSCVVLDMSATTSMDSAGIGVLVFLYKELTAKSKALVLRRPHRNIYGLLMETGIDRLFDVELSSGLKKADAGLSDLNVQLQMDAEMQGDICVIALKGVMNYPSGSMTFKKNMFLTLAAGNKVLLDFKELAFFDSLSVGSVLRLSRLMIDSGGSMRICCANHVVRNVFESLGVDAIIPFYDTKEAALDNWK
ncbi:MAG: STAS domain-containing protein [Chitinispirillia bacterium]|nr:STAS domain-containing protein [Chitinispirillia bacterium]MCL2242555.1 STAS domain-containing protein [Chitinispirillia bacterium]MCL2242808.1 STAS domain-containing protein [Chitinispirillia bacterium]